MSGTVVEICIAPSAGVEPAPVAEALLEADKGIVGDRYYRQSGTFSRKLKDKPDWHATLIELEEVERFNFQHGRDTPAASFRRNIITKGIRLNELVGRRFAIGEAVFEGMRLCEPCAHLGSLLGAEVVKGMVHRAGLRARIVAGAPIHPGDRIRVLTAP